MERRCSLSCSSTRREDGEAAPSVERDGAAAPSAENGDSKRREEADVVADQKEGEGEVIGGRRM